VVFRRRPVTVESPEEHLGGGPADGGRILRDDSDARFQEISQQDVVKADQRNAPVDF
jgi:hypothetical protein